MRYTDDPISDFAACDEECQEWLGSLPKCGHCGAPIEDNTFFVIEEKNVCRDCLYDFCEANCLKFR